MITSRVAVWISVWIICRRSFVAWGHRYVVIRCENTAIPSAWMMLIAACRFRDMGAWRHNVFRVIIWRCLTCPVPGRCEVLSDVIVTVRWHCVNCACQVNCLRVKLFIYFINARCSFAYVSVSQRFSASACDECDIQHALGCGRSRYDSISMMAVTARTA